MKLFELFATLSLDTTDFKSGIGIATDNAKTAEDRLSDLEKRSQDTGNALDDTGESSDGLGSKLLNLAGGGLSKTVSAFKTAVAVGTAFVTTMSTVATAVGNATGKIAEHGDEIDKQSQKLGISAEGYQEWDFILQHSGRSISSLQASMRTLNKAISEQDDALTGLLGVTNEQLRAMSQEEVFNRTITALQGMEQGAERTALATQLLGRGAMELGPLLNTSAEETEEMRKQLHQLGGVMSDEAVKASARYQDAIQDLNTGFEGMKTQLLASFLPSLVEVIHGLTDLFGGNSEQGLSRISEGISTFLESINEKLPEFVTAGVEIIRSIAQAFIDNVPMLVEGGVNLLSNLIDTFIERLPDFIHWAVQVVGQIGVTMLANAPALIAKALELIGALLSGMIGELLNLGKAIVNGVWEGIKARKDDFTSKVTGFFKGIVDGVKSFLGIHSPSKVFAGIGGQMVAGLGEGWEDGIGSVKKDILNDMDFSAVSPEIGLNGQGGYGKNTVSIVQNIYSKRQTRADLAQDTLYYQKKAVMGVV